MIKNKLLLFVFALIITSCFTACAQVKDLHNRLTAYNRIDLTNINSRILQLVNEHRQSIGKEALKMIDVASTQAAQHSRDMMNGSIPFGHEEFEKRVDAIKNNVGFINAAGENVAYGQLTADAVVDGWLHSPGHRKNIEGDYNLTGIGVAQNGEGVVYFTQIFVLKK
ncbi:MAG: CAP domain-containing protein [Bacteroidota bacterium]|nr:CAP domain-containing protein [Bacteroidota bacterium]